jgi:hypothetical protein
MMGIEFMLKETQKGAKLFTLEITPYVTHKMNINHFHKTINDSDRYRAEYFYWGIRTDLSFITGVLKISSVSFLSLDDSKNTTQLKLKYFVMEDL